MTAPSLRPNVHLRPGSYLLTAAGRLRPIGLRGVVAAVAIVHVRAKVAAFVAPVEATVETPPATPLPQPEKPAEPVVLVRAETPENAVSATPPPLAANHVREAIHTRLPSAPPPPEKPRAARVSPRLPADSPPPSPDEDEAMDEFNAKLAEIRARRAEGKPLARQTSDGRSEGLRLATALRRAPARIPPMAPKAPTQRALGTGECIRCGIPGFRGCAHFLPFEGTGERER